MAVPRCSIECPVCGECSDQPYLSYGIKVCNSCRAFFRRIVQHPSAPPGTHYEWFSERLQCQRQGSCPINVKTRRLCQKCRLNKCIAQGMRADLVMNFHQKRQRFRNAIQAVQDVDGMSRFIWKGRRGRELVSAPESSSALPHEAMRSQEPLYTAADAESLAEASDLCRILTGIPNDRGDATATSHHVEAFAQGFLEISVGEDYLKEFLMYSLDVPLSKKFVPQTMKTFASRYVHALRGWDEFQRLTGQDQHDLLKRNLYKAVALCVAKVCRIGAGNEQLMFIMGERDRHVIERKYSGLFNAQSLRSLRMGDINQQTMVLSQELLSEYNGLVDGVSRLVEDFQIFQLISLVTLFADSPYAAKYEAMLERQLRLQNADCILHHALGPGRYQVQALAQIVETMCAH